MQSVSYSVVLAGCRETFAKLAAMCGENVVVSVDASGGRTAAVTWHEHGGTKNVSVSLPTLPPGLMIERSIADRIVAFLVHEFGHVLHTDLEDVRTRCGRDALAFQVANGLEDPRQERALADSGVVPNAADLFHKLAEYLVSDAARVGWSCNAIGDLPFAFAALGRAKLGNAVPSLAGLKISPVMAPLVEYGLSRLPGCKSSRDVVTLALEIVKLARALPQDKPGQGKPGQGKPGQGKPGQGKPGAGEQGEQGEQGEKPGEGKPEPGEGEPGEGEPGEGEPGEGEPGEKPGDKPGEQGAGAGKEGADPKDETISRPGDARLSDIFNQLADKAVARSGMDQLASWERGKSRTNRPPRWRETIDELKAKRLHNRVKSPTVIKGKIRQLLRSPERQNQERFLTAGRLDRRALSRMQAGSLNIYTRRDETPGVNTAVGILLDTSGSMAGDVFDAGAMALHIGEAAQDAGAKVLIAGFSGGLGAINVYKDWREGKTQVSRGLSHIGVAGGTPLSQCTMAMVDQVASRKDCQRHILFAMTDGADNIGETAVGWASDYGASRGVEVIGVSIGRDWRSVGFRYGVTVQAARDLTGTVMSELERQLRRSEMQRK
jgi:hypothetical protein